MAVIETKKESRDPRVWLLVGALAWHRGVGGVVYWMIRPTTPRQVKLTSDQAKQQDVSSVNGGTPMPIFPPAPAAAAGTGCPGPTMVSLDLKQATVRQAMGELFKQSKVDLKTSMPDPGGIIATLMTPRSDISLPNQPFWSGVMELCKKGQARRMRIGTHRTRSCFSRTPSSASCRARWLGRAWWCWIASKAISTPT